MDCPRCGTNDVIDIQQVLPEGVELHFFFCHGCEEKQWLREGKTVPLRDVLDLARDLHH